MGNFLFFQCLFGKRRNQLAIAYQGHGYATHYDTKGQHTSVVAPIYNQQLDQIVKDYKQKIQEASRMAKMMKDPRRYKQFSQLAFSNFLQKLKEKKFQQPAINKNNQCVKLLVGGISSGKSSLINSFFGTTLKVGIGETTQKLDVAYQAKDGDIDILICDTPGECETFNTQNLENVKCIAQSNQVFILFNSSLKKNEHMVRTIAAIKPNRTVLLRTQCDRFQETFSRSLEEEIKEDRKILQKWGISQIEIFSTSAFEKEKYDNIYVKEMIKRRCRQVTKREEFPSTES